MYIYIFFFYKYILVSITVRCSMKRQDPKGNKLCQIPIDLSNRQASITNS